MAYDTKSNTGQQTANPGNPQIGQATVYEQKISSVPLMERQTSSIALQERQTSSIQLGQNTARQVDLLSMDQFGHNQSVLRKDLSILEANSVNTDKEYGVMQVEDKFEFDESSSESITDTVWTTQTMNPFYISNGTVANKFDFSTTNLTITGNGILLPHIINAPSILNDRKSVYGIQCLYTGTKPTCKIGDQNVNLTGTPYLDNNNVMLRDSDEMHFNTDGLDGHQYASISVQNLEASGSSLSIAVRVESLNPNHDSGYTAIAGSGDSTVYKAEISDTSDFEYIRFRIKVYDNSDSSETETILKLTIKNYDGNNDINWFVVQIPSGIKIPQCQLILSTRHDGETTTNSVVLQKSFAESGTPKTRITNRVNSVFDWSYAVYSNSKAISGSISIKPVMFKSNDFDFYLVSESSDIDGFVTYSNRSLFSKYYTIVSLSGTSSIGILKRSDSSLQLCIKNGSSYFTAKDDFPLSIQDFKLTGLKIIRSSELEISFVAEFNGNKKYFLFQRSDMIELNKLLPGSRSLYLFMSYDLDSVLYRDELAVMQTSSNELPVFQCSIVSVDTNLYSKLTKSFPVPLTKHNDDTPRNTAFVISTKYGLSNSILDIAGLGNYVTDNLMMYSVNAIHANLFIGFDTVSLKVIPIYTQADNNSLFKHICTINSYDPKVNNFVSLPLRMEDEYPEVYYNSSVGTESFVLGKTAFVNVDGTVYESGSLLLCPNMGKRYLSEPGSKMYVTYPYLLLAKSRLTNVYQFTELGMQLSMTIEDEIICNPVTSSVGIVMCGRTGIWTLTKEGVVKIWKSAKTILQASLKTDLDNSCIAVIDDDSFDVQVLAGSQLPGVLDEDVIATDYIDDTMEYPVCCGTSIFTAVTINQFGFVSSQKINTNLNAVDFIDIGAESELLILDLVGSGTLNTLVKGVETETSFTIQSNQLIEMYQETVYTTLNKIRLFAKGSGTITVTINDTVVGTVTVSGTRFEEYNLTLNTDMNMLDYKITCTAGVKLMQRVVGIITTKEEFYG